MMSSRSHIIFASFPLATKIRNIKRLNIILMPIIGTTSSVANGNLFEIKKTTMMMTMSPNKSAAFTLFELRFFGFSVMLLAGFGENEDPSKITANTR